MFVEFSIRNSSAAAVVLHDSTAAANAAIQRAVYSAAAVRTATKNGSACFFMFGVLSLHSTMAVCRTPWQYVMSHLRPLFAYNIRDSYGQTRSRRRASARRGEAPLCNQPFFRSWTKVHTGLLA